jgi:MFS transporter, DHA1 family, multidrug resistance protein
MMRRAGRIGSRAEASGPVDWRRNLAALWFSQFTATFGFSFVFPFLPLFLHLDLGLSDPRQLAFWSGLVAGATGFTQAVASPIWGSLGDRFGRKQMVIRAMLGGALSVALMGVVESAGELLGARMLLGVMSGTVPAATALVAAETPPQEVGWALGILSSGVALGRSIGPLVGGLLAALTSLRAVFVGSGAILALASLVVIALVRETPRERRRLSIASVREIVGAAAPGTVGVLGALVGCQLLMQFAYASAQQLVVLRLLVLHPTNPALVTGLAFAAGGLATIVSATNYSRLLALGGYRLLAIAAALLLAVTILALALAPTVPTVIAALAACGFVFGALNPALASMIGLETPAAVKATVFGISASCISLGFGVGPLVAGAAASLLDVRAGLLVAAAAAAATAAVLARWVREPA